MENLYDVIVVGGGPAGLTAALYLARARCHVLVLEKDQPGGQIAITDEVVNYPGIAKISGRALTDTMRAQAEHFGAEFAQGEAENFSLAGDVKTVRTAAGEYRALGVLLAVGAQPRSVGFRGEEEYKGRGVAYCATCDGEFFAGKDIFVVGGGYAAAEESIFLTRYARHVTILIRRSDFSCAASVAAQARAHEKITVLTDTVLEEVSGGANGLDYARYRNSVSGEVTEHRAAAGESFGVFVFAGYAPATERLRGVVALDERGHILTDRTQKTEIDGVYAAGDVCVKPLRQVVTAVGDGALAATELEKYAAAARERMGLAPSVPQRRQGGAPNAGSPTGERGFFDDAMRAQLAEVFEKMQRPLRLRLYPDGTPLSRELEEFTASLCAMTEKLTMETARERADGAETPYLAVCGADGTETGLFFHGVPGGHEFTSFILGLCCASGAAQPTDEETRHRIAAVRPATLAVLVTLSCTMCPALVTAAQRIAAENPAVTAHIYDVRHFPALRERYGVQSVPCLVIDGKRVYFGRKDLGALLSLLEEE